MNGLFSLNQAGMEEQDSGGNMENVENLKEELEAELTTQPTSSKKSYDPLSVLHRHHPECLLDYSESVMQKLQLKAVGSTEDPNHKSQPSYHSSRRHAFLAFGPINLLRVLGPLLRFRHTLQALLILQRWSWSNGVFPLL